jgi:hypothetical protein
MNAPKDDLLNNPYFSGGYALMPSHSLLEFMRFIPYNKIMDKEILPSALKHGFSKEDILYAMKLSKAVALVAKKYLEEIDAVVEHAKAQGYTFSEFVSLVAQSSVKKGLRIN